MSKQWLVADKINQEIISENSAYSPILLQLLFNRNIKAKEAIEAFLNVEYGGENYSPFLFNNMDKAADLIISHIKNKSKIVVYGDYDADGVTSSAVLFDVLTTLKAEVEIYLPNRETEGYGLNKNAVEEIAKSGVKLIITVDNGIRNKEEVNFAKEKGLDIVLTDHHEGASDQSEWPDCLIVNPILEGEKYPFRFLAGVGVAFKLAEAIIEKSKLAEADKQKLKERNLDLVAIGTVADCVRLDGENRLLVKKGLEVLNNTNRLGLQEIFKIAQIDKKELFAWNIGFQIAPRLNAAGRLEHANTAFEILVTRDAEEAKTLARDLDNKNYSRQRATDNITDNIVAQIERERDPEAKILIAVSPEVADPNAEAWKEGVVGLVSGKITEKFYLPSLVITASDKEGIIKGSGRSIEEFNLIGAVEECADLLLKYGGHKMACGFSLEKEKLSAFQEKISRIAKEKLEGKDIRPKIKIDAEINLAEATEELCYDIVKLEPFGVGNSEPILASHNCQVMDVMMMGMENQHIKLKLKSAESYVKTAIGFSQAEKWKDLQIGDTIDIAYYLDLNRYNGREEAQLKIVDIKKK